VFINKHVSCSADRTIGVDGVICLTAAVALLAVGVLGYIVFTSSCAAADDSVVTEAAGVTLSADDPSAHISSTCFTHSGVITISS